jgi:hypothetical protein
MNGPYPARSLWFAIVAMLVVLGLARLLPYLGVLLIIAGDLLGHWNGLDRFATRVFFLRWAVFPWVAVYPASEMGPYSPTGSPVGEWASVVQWVIITIVFSAIAHQLSRRLVVVLAVATVVAVTIAVNSLLIPFLGMRFFLQGP